MEEHVFAASAYWSGGDEGQGVVEAAGLAASQFSLPAQFGGTVSGSNPEELLLSALAACLSMTTAFGLESRSIAFEAIHVEAIGKVLRKPTRFDSFEVSIRVTLPTDSSEETRSKALEFASRADAGCLISKIVGKSAPVRVSASVE